MMWLVAGGMAVTVAAFSTWVCQATRARLNLLSRTHQLIHERPLLIRRHIMDEKNVCWSCDDRPAVTDDDLGLCISCRGTLLSAE